METETVQPVTLSFEVINACPELQALHVAAQAIERLCTNDAERGRIVRYLADKYGAAP